MRWLKGDLEGAIEAMQLAASAATPIDAESASWVNTRLAFYEFQAGRVNEAEQRCALALSLQNNYPPTLLLKGKILLAQNRPASRGRFAKCREAGSAFGISGRWARRCA